MNISDWFSAVSTNLHSKRKVIFEVVPANTEILDGISSQQRALIIGTLEQEKEILANANAEKNRVSMLAGTKQIVTFLLRCKLRETTENLSETL